MPQFDNLNRFTRGWLVGDFTPSLFRSQDYEVAIMHHKKNEATTPHRHNFSTEYNIIVQGFVVVNGKKLKAGDIFVYEKKEISNVEFESDTILCVIRTPSLPSDKEVLS
jgi:mannose-6-phosphate isomerase-like protein (cupin superfamily)